MRIPINRGSIEIVRGDIAEESSDAIVNAANNHLWMGAGVAGAIKRKGGDEIEQEAIAKGPINIGDAIITRAGSLATRHVIHAAVMGQDLHTDATKIEKATLSSLQLAEKHKFTSMSFPALGTGVGGFSPFHCAKIMIATSVGYLQGSKHLRNVRLVLFDQATFDAFEEELKLQFSSKRH